MRTMRSGCGITCFRFCDSAVPSPPNLSRSIAVACGGNAEALVRLAPGPFVGRTPTINVRLLKDQTWRLAAARRAGPNASVSREKRSRGSDGNRRDHHYDAREMAGPAVHAGAGSGRARRHSARSRRGAVLGGVGVRGRKGPRGGIARRRALVWAALRITTSSTPSKWRASRFRFSTNCVRCTRWARTCGSFWRWARCLHDVGYYVNRKSHHRHGEYLIRNGEIPGLRGWRRDMVAALVRYHNSKSEPADRSPVLRGAGWPAAASRCGCSLRCCASRKSSNPSTRNASQAWTCKSQAARRFSMFARRKARGSISRALERKADLFEKEFHLKPEFRREPQKEKEKVA